MQSLVNIAVESWNVWQETALYVLIGFALAGLIQAVGLGRPVLNRLTRPGFRSVLLGSFVGLPLPLCSCGVLPTAIALRRRGARHSSVISFLVAAPEIGVPSMLITYALLGPFVAVFRPIAAFVTAIAAGLVVHFVAPDEAEGRSVADDAPVETGPDAAAPGVHWARRAFRFAFVELLDDIAGWLVFGIVAAGVIRVFMPTLLSDWVLGGPWRSMMLMAVIGVPLYVCATSSTPIAAAIIGQGINPGAALVFLLVGPATNVGSIGVLTKELGRRIVFAYLATVVVVAIGMGLYFNLLLNMAGINLAARIAPGEAAGASLSEWIGAFVLLALCIRSFRRTHPGERLIAWIARYTNLPLPARACRWTVAVCAVVGYFASGFYTVGPGEVGAVKCFGRVQQPLRPPGLGYHLPVPIGAIDIIPVDRVHRVTIGFAPSLLAGQRRPPATITDAETVAPHPGESLILSGDENILDLKAVVRFAVETDEVLAFAYGTDEPHELVKRMTHAVIRETIAARRVDDVLTSQRGEIESAIAATLSESLDRCVCGIRVVSFQLVDVHAPPDVHEAFRDVASAARDRATIISHACVDEARMIPLARGQAAQQVHEAGAYADRTVNEAAGRAARFLQQLEAYAAAPRPTRTRLHYDTLVRVLPAFEIYIRPPANSPTELELLFLEGAVRTRPQLSGTEASPAQNGRGDERLTIETLKELRGP